MPDLLPISKPHEKKFFWGVLYAIAPGFANAAIDAAIHKRVLAREELKKDQVPIADDWALELVSKPCLKCKCTQLNIRPNSLIIETKKGKNGYLFINRAAEKKVTKKRTYDMAFKVKDFVDEKKTLRVTSIKKFKPNPEANDGQIQPSIDEKDQ